jgi:hypothetical protein
MAAPSQIRRPFQVATNQWTAGLRMFSLIRYALKASDTIETGNLIQKGSDITSKILARSFSPITGYDGSIFSASNGDYIQWDTSWTGKFLGPVTVIARCLPTSVDTAGQLWGTHDVSSGDGCTLQISAASGCGWFVGNGGGTFISDGDVAGSVNNEFTLGGSYDPSGAGTMRLYKSGVLVASNTSAGASHNTSSAGFASTGRFSTGGGAGVTFGLNGSVWWVAVFNRALSAPEMVAWTTTHDPIAMVQIPQKTRGGTGAPPPYITGNDIVVDQTFIGDSPFVLGTVLTAGAATGGDIPSSGGGGFAQINDINVFQFLNMVESIPSLTQNVIDVDQFVTFVEQYSTANNIDVGTILNLFLADEPNVLVGNRYQR